MGGSRINKACDGCRYRKVKCNGETPCSQCAHLDLQCVFSPPTAKRKPGVRGRLVAQLRQNNSIGSGGSSNGATRGKGNGSSPGSSWTQNSKQDRMEPGGGTESGEDQVLHQPPVTSVAGIINFMDTPPNNRLNRPYPLNDVHPHPQLRTDMAPPRQPSYSDTPDTNYAATATDANPYPQSFFLDLVHDFEHLIYPVNPVITPDEIRAAVTTMNAHHEDAALVYAFAAVTINLTHTSWHLNGDVAAHMTDLIQRSLKAHRRADITLVFSNFNNAANHTSSPFPSPSNAAAQRADAKTAPVLGDLPVTVKRAMTCILLEMSFMAFKNFDRSFTMLREAISLTLALKVHAHTPDDPHLDRREVARRQRLYWECFIHERFVNIATGYPCTLVPLRTGLPYSDLSLQANVDLGFRRLIRLFMIMDDEFFTYWNADLLPVQARQQQQQHNAHFAASPIAMAASPVSVTSTNTLNPHEMTAEWIERKQAELDEDEVETARAVASSPTGLTELQRADLYITRLWMRTLVWQLALSRGLLRSLPPDHPSSSSSSRQSHHHHRHHQGLSLHYPAARLSHQLRTLVCRLESVYSIGTHGSSILQKLFEITTTVADVLALPPDQSQDVKSRMEDFIFLVSFLLQFERMPKRQRDYMREKVEVLQQMYTVVDFGDLADARSR